MSQYHTPPVHPHAHHHCHHHHQDTDRSTGPGPGQAGEMERSSYLKMLTNMANDLEQLLTDLNHTHPFTSEDVDQTPGEKAGLGGTGTGTGTGTGIGTPDSTSALYHTPPRRKDGGIKDAAQSSGTIMSRRIGKDHLSLGDGFGSMASMQTSSSDNNLSADSDHGDHRQPPASSPLSFHPNNSLTYSHKTADKRSKSPMTSPSPATSSPNPDTGSHSSGDLRPISLMERLATTHSIWLLAQMSRAGAVHLLKDRETGVFIIRKSSQAKSLALSVQNRLRERTNVDHFLIEMCDQGMRLQGSAHVFHSIPALLAHYMEFLDELPYRLTLPEAILHAKSPRELASLAMLGQDFWLSLISHQTGSPPANMGVLQHFDGDGPTTRQQFQTASYCEMPNPSALDPKTLPALSFSPLSDLLRDQDDQQAFRKQLSVQMAASHQRTCHSRPTFTYSVPEVGGEGHFPSGPHMLRLKGSKDTLTDSGGEEGDTLLRPHLQLMSTSPRSCDFSDFGTPPDFSCLRDHEPQCRPNVYSMAPLELHDPPDDFYFRSSLSDKMSDYEDVWRGSCYDSDSLRNGSVRGAGNYDGNSVVTARSEFSKFFAISSNKSGSLVKPATGKLPSLDGRSNISATTKASRPTKLKYVKHNVNGNFLSPFGKLTRLKSSSESSLATLPSPIYAEPVDSVVFREKKSKTSKQHRRLSAPSPSPEMESLDFSHLGMDHRVAPVDVPKCPPVEWPDTNYQFCNTLPNKLNTASKRGDSSEFKHSGGSWRSRSHSMSAHLDDDKANRKTPGWQERFNRLKLGTKVLSAHSSPYAASAANSHPRLDGSLRAVGQTRTLQSEAPNNVFVPKFPVSHHNNRVTPAAQRMSHWSESSTVQDMISRAMPEVIIHPVQSQPVLGLVDKPMSEYDNFSPYSPPSAASHSTVFCKPWETGMVNTLIQTSRMQLPPAMDLQERVQKWQEANQTFQEQHKDRQYNLHRQGEGEAAHLCHHNVMKKTHSVVSMGGHYSSETIAATQLEVDTDGGKKDTEGAGGSTLYQQPGVRSKKPLNRPQSFYHHSQEQTHPKRVQVKLMRSNSQPSQPCPALPRNIRHHHNLYQHCHTDTGLQVVREASTISGRDGEKGVLSSHCPDVINCHHVTMSNMSANHPQSPALLNTGQRVPRHIQMNEGPGGKIKEYIQKLSQDHSTIFGGSIDYFIRCTMESQDRNPYHVMRNVRQFMTGIKNYLVKHGEGQFEALIETERGKLGTNEILNIDGLIETTLHVCVLKPLKHHIYRLLVDFHHRSHSLEMISKNIRYARTKSPQELGIKTGQTPPQSFDVDVTIKGYLMDMQRAYSPLVKLECLLKVTSAICSSVKIQGKPVPLRGPGSLGADDFLPLLIYALVHCGLVSAELEADYMWGLLHPSVLTGEGGYYLTTLSSAVLLLKNFQKAHENKAPTLEAQLPSTGEVQGFLKIAFPDELRDAIVWKTLPVRPNMTTKDVCAMIAHKFKFTNPQDYGLILLCDGEERQLDDGQCPQILKRDNMAAGKDFFFAYKRLDANIAWPSSIQQS